jgi:anti-sigma factor (TIGR02949 family)
MPTHRDPRDCESILRALWDYLDRELEPSDMAAIDAHLGACASCRSHAAFERRLVDEIRALRAEVTEPEKLRARVLQVLRRARGVDPTA